MKIPRSADLTADLPPSSRPGRATRHLSGKLATVGAAAALVLGLFGAAPVAASSPGGYTCTGNLEDPGWVPAGTWAYLSMPAGSLCFVAGPDPLTVMSPIRIGDDAGLLVLGGALTIGGGVTVGMGGAFAAGLYDESSQVQINGPVRALSGSVFLLGGAEVPYGPIFARVGGSVTAQDAAIVVFHHTRIDGRAAIIGGGGEPNAIVDALFGPGTPNFTLFEDSQIHGAVTEIGYRGAWAGVIRSKIWGSLKFVGNVGAEEYDIGSNVIYGSAFCADNEPAPNAGDSAGAVSIVAGQTYGNQAATCTGIEGGFTGPPPA